MSEVIDLVCLVKFQRRHLHHKNKRTVILDKIPYVVMNFKNERKMWWGAWKWTKM